MNLRLTMRRIRSCLLPREHWVRIVMNREVKKMVHNIHPEKLRTLEISGTAWKNTFPFRSYQSAGLPDLDICTATLEGKFGFIIAEQVFEHLLWPYRAGRNILSMLEPGGYFLLTTPFLLRVHPCPFDCTRWTETGIRYFLAECGFPIQDIQTGSWGNRSAVIANLEQWRAYRSWLHPLENETDFPVVVWALGRKKYGE